MAEDSQFAQATQQFSFQDFLERMKEPAAADLVRYIKTFIKTVEDRPSNPDADGQAFQDFMTRMEEVFERHPVWQSASHDVKSQAVEALEKYVMTKLYTRAFGISSLDQERDEMLTQRMTALAFIQPTHLDIPEAYCNENSWVLAQRELLRINTYKAPRDKLVCILNCCRIINNLLHTGAAAGDGKGADDFLPILIFVTIHANPPKLASNLEYIQRYRMQSRMMAEAAYFFTQMYSAASFIETINAGSLTIDPDEFVARMIAAGVPDTGISTVPSLPRQGDVHTGAGVGGATGPPPGGPPGNVTVPSPSVVTGVEEQYTGNQVSPQGPVPPLPPIILPSPAELEAEGVAHLVALETSGELRARHTYLYATAADLTLGDVRILLEQYKKLALHYEALHAAVNTRHAASRTAAEQATASTSVLPPLTTTAIPIPDPAAASQPTGDEDGSPSMLKLLNPFTRVPRAIKGTLSLLDGTTSLIPSTAAAAWSATAAAAAATTAAVGGGGEVRVRPKPM